MDASPWPEHDQPLVTGLLKDPTSTLLSALRAGTRLTPRVGSRRGRPPCQVRLHGRPGTLVACMLLTGRGGAL